MRGLFDNQFQFEIEGKVLHFVDSFHIQKENGDLVNVPEKIRKLVREKIKPASKMRIYVRVEWE